MNNNDKIIEEACEKINSIYGNLRLINETDKFINIIVSKKVNLKHILFNHLGYRKYEFYLEVSYGEKNILTKEEFDFLLLYIRSYHFMKDDKEVEKEENVR